MLRKVFRLVIGLISGYLSVSWMTNVIPLHSGEFTSDTILNPAGFLAGTMAMAVGMYMMGGLIGEGVKAVQSTIKRDGGSVSDVLLAIAGLDGILLLLPLGGWQAAVFFVFCLLYGMMSFSSTEDKDKSQKQ
ncbi:hypothetical protein [Mesobacillus jeotgali]|uniref:hypothetical protein n=1 Tax=Mesobacillus jeotgali TaxID=129985 RepID=UPI0009A72CCE|nr:hypothetical protein [Mesobacillus jeotgali]